MTRSRILVAVAFITILAIAGLTLAGPATAGTADGGGGGGGSCTVNGSKIETYSYSGCPSGTLAVGFHYKCCSGSCSWVQVSSWCL